MVSVTDISAPLDHTHTECLEAHRQINARYNTVRAELLAAATRWLSEMETRWPR